MENNEGKGGRRNGKGIKGKSQRKNEKKQRQQKKKPMESTLSKVDLFPSLSFSCSEGTMNFFGTRKTIIIISNVLLQLPTEQFGLQVG